MVYLDLIWGLPRYAEISGSKVRIPFGIDLPYRLVEFLVKWISNSGCEWTVGRMKALNVWALQILSGNHSYTQPWFKRITYKGYEIPDLPIFKFLVDNRYDSLRIRKVFMVLRSYKLGTWGSPSLTSVVEGSSIPTTEAYIPLLTKYVSLPKVPDSVLERTEVINTLKRWADDQGKTHPGPYALLDEEYPAEIRFLFQEKNSDPWCQGRLTAIPDKGKWRTILVGHYAVQLKTKKLADWLRNWLWKQPECASGDQEVMRNFMVKSLSQGRTMLSIDLSSATDRLSREFQINLLHHMGVPKRYFNFLELPFFYDQKFFGQSGDGLAKGRYKQGQPMGLYLSFPMFELAHYVILKFVTATTDAEFRVLGDDVVISCSPTDAANLYSRYENLITRLGGIIDKSKSLISDLLAEGAGCLTLKGNQSKIWIPSGHISLIEAQLKGTWLNQQITNQTPIGMAISSSWLSTQENMEYTHDHRRRLNELLVLNDHSDFSVEALRYLGSHRIEPVKWKSWEDPPSQIGLDKPRFEVDEGPDPEPVRYRWTSKARYREAQVSTKIISLYKSYLNKDKTNEE
jgi:hypothetical protein